MPTARSGASACGMTVSAMNVASPRGCSETMSSTMSPSTGVMTGFSDPSVRLSNQALYSGGAMTAAGSASSAAVHGTMVVVAVNSPHLLQLTSTPLLPSHNRYAEM